MLLHVTVHQPMVRGAMRKPLLWLSNLLLLGGIAAMLAGGWALLDGRFYQSVQRRQMEEVVNAVINDDVDRGAATPAAAPQPVSPLRSLLTKAVLPKRDPLAIGELEVPRLGMDVVVREGVDDSSLRKAVGHLPSSALPGEAGNVVLLGHRDTFFRPLREITGGDVIRVRVAGRSFVYNVQSVQVTEPDWPGAVERTREPVVTLITCFPFEYIGSAPRRFVVRAKLEH
jgi:sortase A